MNLIMRAWRLYKSWRYRLAGLCPNCGSERYYRIGCPTQACLNCDYNEGEKLFQYLCDRCHKPIRVETERDGVTFTAGYYDHRGWGHMMDAREKYLCDNCMQSDPRYIRIYGKPRLP